MKTYYNQNDSSVSSTYDADSFKHIFCDSSVANRLGRKMKGTFDLTFTKGQMTGFL